MTGNILFQSKISVNVLKNGNLHFKTGNNKDEKQKFIKVVTDVLFSFNMLGSFYKQRHFIQIYYVR